MTTNNKEYIMKKKKETNKHNISLSLLKSIKYIDKNDYDLVNKVTKMKNDSNKTYYYINYDSVKPSYLMKSTIKPFNRTKKYVTSQKPVMKISSIYNQSMYRTTDIQKYIDLLNKEEKKVA
jgi:hypothetical protein